MWTKAISLVSFFIVVSHAIDIGSVDGVAEVRHQSESALPQCATLCLASLLRTTTCAPTNVECLCHDTSFLQASAACVQANCTVVEALAAQRVQTTIICPQPIRDQSGLTIRVVWALSSLATFSVLARLLSRIQALGGSGLGHDDWTILLGGLLLLTPLNVILYFMALDGLGRDIWTVSPRQITNILYLFWVEEFLYTFILALTKISVLLLYLRMWPDTESKRFRNACIGLIVLLSVYAVAMNVVLAASCSPVSYAWTRWDGEHQGSCINLQGQIFATAALNILWDLLVFLLPLPKFIKLSFGSTKKKAAVCLTFVVGLFVTVCSIVRLRYLAVWGSSTNATWGYNPIAIWSNVECNLSVMCACMPALAGLLQRFWAYASGHDISGCGRSRQTLSGDQKPGQHYEMRLRSTSLSDSARRKRRTLLEGLDLNPVDPRFFDHQAEFDEERFEYFRHFNATRPLPRVG